MQSLRDSARHRHRSGFTLIELLIVVVIIGILAAIAVPKFSNTKGRAYVAAMKSDLRNLATAEEAYFYDYSVYTADLSRLKFSPSTGVTVTATVTAGGWAAEAQHPLANPVHCYLFFGDAGPIGAADSEGNVACDN